ncbi:hypothetical protein GTY44_16515 [Streptomyces sp. SID5914]|nr:hypothetical protein [Streptomyces sp. SID5914]MZG15071.1 hypothetical protein [Streptomyces sp. SID5914]
MVDARQREVGRRTRRVVLAVMLLVGSTSLGLYTYLGTILITTADLLPLYLMRWSAATVAGNLAVARLLDWGR